MKKLIIVGAITIVVLGLLGLFIPNRTVEEPLGGGLDIDTPVNINNVHLEGGEIMLPNGKHLGQLSRGQKNALKTMLKDKGTTDLYSNNSLNYNEVQMVLDLYNEAPFAIEQVEDDILGAILINL